MTDLPDPPKRKVTARVTNVRTRGKLESKGANEPPPGGASQGEEISSLRFEGQAITPDEIAALDSAILRDLAERFQRRGRKGVPPPTPAPGDPTLSPHDSDPHDSDPHDSDPHDRDAGDFDRDNFDRDNFDRE